MGIDFGVEQIVVGVRGELDMATAAHLGSVLDAVVGQPTSDIVLDLAELEFVDPAGLRVVVAAATHLRAAGRWLTLRSVPAMTSRVLHVSGVGELVHLEAAGPIIVTIDPVPRARVRAAAMAGQPSERLDLNALASLAAADEVIDHALRQVVVLANATVGGADGVSVSLNRRGQLMTVASTDETIMQMDRDQYATGQGPCVSAAAEGLCFHVPSLVTETRWPEFVPRAIRGGIGSILSSPLMVGTAAVGALNIYSTTKSAFGSADQDLAAMFAHQASGILTDAGTTAVSEECGRRLQDALLGREVMAQAQGVLMERTGASAEEASAVLRRSARDVGGSLRQQAVDIVATTHQESSKSPLGTHG